MTNLAVPCICCDFRQSLLWMNKAQLYQILCFIVHNMLNKQVLQCCMSFMYRSSCFLLPPVLLHKDQLVVRMHPPKRFSATFRAAEKSVSHAKRAESKRTAHCPGPNALQLNLPSTQTECVNVGRWGRMRAGGGGSVSSNSCRSETTESKKNKLHFKRLFAVQRIPVPLT